MKRPIAVLLILLTPWQGMSQSKSHKTLDELGWEMVNLSIPEKLTDLDTGTVTYLVKINDAGTVLRMKTLENTFDASVERLWRRAVMNSTFRNTAVTTPMGKRITGTTSITREYCNPPTPAEPLSPKGQTGLFKNQ